MTRLSLTPLAGVLPLVVRARSVFPIAFELASFSADAIREMLDREGSYRPLIPGAAQALWRSR
jgi:hypothetical protein